MVVLDFCFVFLLVDNIEYAQNNSYKILFLYILQSRFVSLRNHIPANLDKESLCAY